MVLNSSWSDVGVNRQECMHMLSSLGRHLEMANLLDSLWPQVVERMSSLDLGVELSKRLYKVANDYYLQVKVHTQSHVEDCSVLLNSMDAVYILNAFGRCHSCSNASQLMDLFFDALLRETQHWALSNSAHKPPTTD